MSGRDAEKLETEAVSLLKELGLTEYEAYTLVYLFRLGTATAKEIADMNGVPRTRVYDAVDTLHDHGLVDVQYSSPRKFTPVSRDTAIRKLQLSYQNTLTELDEAIDQLEPVERRTEEFGVWTVSGREAVSSRVFEFVDDAEDQVIYMTVDELLTDEHLDRLQAAEQRGVDIYLAGISEEVRDRIQETIPSAAVFETLWSGPTSAPEACSSPTSAPRS
jgi:sugar-specific transcriptional regulator TrmB